MAAWRSKQNPHTLNLSNGVPAPAGAISDIVATAGGDTVPEFDLNLTNHFPDYQCLPYDPCLAVAWCICVNTIHAARPGMVIKQTLPI